MLARIAAWLAATTASHFIGSVGWLVPLLQAVHILAISVTLSSVGMIVLRIMGWTGVRTSLANTSRRYVPWIWGGLVTLLGSGVILILGEPARSLVNPAFQAKMALLLCAIAITATFQISAAQKVSSWDRDRQGGAVARTLAVATLLLWFAIAVAGRLIAYLATT